jgi:hypothetical protein
LPRSPHFSGRRGSTAAFCGDFTASDDFSSAVLGDFSLAETSRSDSRHPNENYT